MSQAAPIPVEQSIALKRARRLETVPVSRRRVFERSWSGQASPRACIKAFCLECLGFDEAAIRDCTAWACPLWRLRPYQRKEVQ